MRMSLSCQADTKHYPQNISRSWSPDLWQFGSSPVSFHQWLPQWRILQAEQKWKCKSAPAWTSALSADETDRKYLQPKITPKCFSFQPTWNDLCWLGREGSEENCIREIYLSWSAILPYIIDSYQDWSSSLIVAATKQHFRDDDDNGYCWPVQLSLSSITKLQSK